jgi:hypothetical protein
MVETADHILICQSSLAITYRETLLTSFLSDLEKSGTGTDELLLYIFSAKLSTLFQITIPTTYQSHPINDPMIIQIMVAAVNHQNILGRENFLKGYVSHSWHLLQEAHQNMDSQSLKAWEQSLTTLAITHYKSLWDDRNKSIHGNTRLEAKQKLPDQVL